MSSSCWSIAESVGFSFSVASSTRNEFETIGTGYSINGESTGDGIVIASRQCQFADGVSLLSASVGLMCW